MENLAPAGNRESLERAEAAGADAVYLGYSAFSARAGAGNFDRHELEEAIRFAHFHHMRVYVTVNTLVKDAELAEVENVLRLLAHLHADGVLVQDIGVFRLARQKFPGLPVHASTQMAIHNRTGVEFCRKEGMKRVVLARECSLEEIRKCTGTGTEIEVFGHGAQCVSVSGMCLFSSMIGERSGNRGRCAQPCRLEYTFRGRKAAWLSPRDVCLRRELKQLKHAGVASVKLEGRLKRPEYVGVVTSAYRRGIDAATADAADRFVDEDVGELKQIFNRGGFMRGYAMGCSDAAVIHPERVDHEGVEIGRVETVNGQMARVRVRMTLNDGDGLRFDNGFEQNDMIYAGKETAAGETALVRLRADMKVKNGDPVIRLTDAAQLEKIRQLPSHRIMVDMTLDAFPDQPLSISVTDGESTVTVQSEPVQLALNRAAQPEDLARNLAKTGGTAYEPGKLEVHTEQAFVPVSVLNALRRQALDELTEARIRHFEYDTTEEKPLQAFPAGCDSAAGIVICRTAEQIAAAAGSGRLPVLSPEDYRIEKLEQLLKTLPQGIWLDLPAVCEEDTLQQLFHFVEKHREQLGGVMLESVGQLGAAWPLPFAAGTGIPVMNRMAAAFLTEHGCSFMTVSQELSETETRELMECGLPLVIPAWGRTQLMLLHHCPARTLLGWSGDRKNCSLCDVNDSRALKGEKLKDRFGYEFPLLRIKLPEGCLVRLMNSRTTDLLDKTGSWPISVSFAEEDGQTVKNVLEAAEKHCCYGAESTTGHWNRPVE